MNMTWNLDTLYHGFDDPKYKEDIKKLQSIIKELNEAATRYSEMEPLTCIEHYLAKTEEIVKVINDAYTYASLRLTTNVNDQEASIENTKLAIMLQDLVYPSVCYQKCLKDVDLDELKNKSKLLNTYLFMVKNDQDNAKHMLSEKEEILYSKLKVVASSSWEEMQSTLTANLVCNVDGKDLPLSTVRNMAYENDKDLRKKAYEAELKAYKMIDTSVAMSINNIKRQVNIMDDLRGYKSELERTLEASHMSEKTLNAMIEAMREEMPNFRKYLYLKAKALGYKNGLPFYELFAPMGELTKKYTYEEARDLVLDVYKSFSMPLYEMGKKAFDERWIDVLPHDGKVGGAFCADLSNYNESRVLTNFTGSLGDVQTLAHELGHAYHGNVCNKNAILNRDYPMQLAETASIFCQTLMAKKMIDDFTDPKEKLTVIEESLQEDTQCVIDILSRFVFEKSVLETPIDTPLSSEDLCAMMLKAQDETYGDGLDKEYRHPYMWLCKSHYYSADLSYYNWPYAFGLLYAKGLYKLYLDDKEAFVAKYDEMLKDTSLMNVEEVAKTMNIDLTKKDFWISSLKFIEEDITLFEELLKELNYIN